MATLPEIGGTVLYHGLKAVRVENAPGDDFQKTAACDRAHRDGYVGIGGFQRAIPKAEWKRRVTLRVGGSLTVRTTAEDPGIGSRKKRPGYRVATTGAPINAARAFRAWMAAGSIERRFAERCKKARRADFEAAANRARQQGRNVDASDPTLPVEYPWGER